MLHRRTRKALELGEELEILLVHLNFLLQLLGLELHCADLHFLGADFLTSVFPDSARAVPRGKNTNAFGSLSIERAVDGLRGQRRHDDLDQPLAGSNVNLARDKRISLIDSHGRHTAGGALGRRV